jgi:type VI protein secretion system component Hcp
VTKWIDSASSTIQQYALKAIVNECTIQYLHTDIGGGKVYRSLQLADCIISSVNSDGGASERPREYLTLNFTEITVSDIVYTDADSEGTQSHVVYSLEQATTL